MIRTSTLLLAACLVTTGMAQKVTVKSGNFKELKGEKEVDLEFTYDGMRVGKYDEAEYIAKKKKEYDAKEPGRGETFEKSWFADRATRFEPKFEELFNDAGPIKGFRGTEAAKYVLVVHTSFTEPGFNIGVTKKAAAINAEVSLKEKASGNVVGVITMVDVPGSQFAGYDYDTGSRLAESYAKLAKELRQWMAKNVFK